MIKVFFEWVFVKNPLQEDSKTQDVEEVDSSIFTIKVDSKPYYCNKCDFETKQRRFMIEEGFSIYRQLKFSL